MSESFMKHVYSWNEKIYRDENGNHVGGGLNSENLWNEFGIKSGPKFMEACWSHIPEKWAEEVRALIRSAQSELDERVSFVQIKEKFCRLTIYCDYTDKEARQRMGELVEKCIKKLVKQGVHPPKQGERND